MSQTTATLFAACQELTMREETVLEAVLADLHRVRQMLAGADSESLAAALRCSLQAAEPWTTLRQQRERFRQTAADCMRVAPCAVTLRAAGEFLPREQGLVVERQRRRLVELARQVQMLQQSNAEIVWWCLNFVQEVLAEIQVRPRGSRYSASGKAQTGVCGPTWQGQG